MIFRVPPRTRMRSGSGATTPPLRGCSLKTGEAGSPRRRDQLSPCQGGVARSGEGVPAEAAISTHEQPSSGSSSRVLPVRWSDRASSASRSSNSPDSGREKSSDHFCSDPSSASRKRANLSCPSVGSADARLNAFCGRSFIRPLLKPGAYNSSGGQVGARSRTVTGRMPW